ncbi:MAG: DNA-binding protein [Acidobacteria bacterium]|nr:DNA-binding protein [Acidobacteriota bacterium]
MKAKRMSKDPGAAVWALVFERGDEVISGLTAFAREHRLAGSQLSAIGAFSDVTLGYFERSLREYRRIRLEEQVEVLSLNGDIALENGQPKIHAHVVIGRGDATVRGGHLLEGHVWPTLEVIVQESARKLVRRFDPEVGIALIDLEAAEPSPGESPAAKAPAAGAAAAAQAPPPARRQ